MVLDNRGTWAVEPLLTLYKDLRDFGVTGAESTIDFKPVCVVQERASQWEKDFLSKVKEENKHFSLCTCIS